MCALYYYIDSQSHAHKRQFDLMSYADHPARLYVVNANVSKASLQACVSNAREKEILPVCRVEKKEGIRCDLIDSRRELERRYRLRPHK